MILCLDIGNSQIFCGIYKNQKCELLFRCDNKSNYTSDQYGVFLKNVLRENNVKIDKITNIAISSVVPQVNYSMYSACIKYFDIEPFILESGSITNLVIKYINPEELGTDRLANAIAAKHLFPKENIVVVDMGTATTINVITEKSEFKGGIITAGVKLSISALENNTSNLNSVQIVKPKSLIGKTTSQGLQSGLYYGHLAMLKGLIQEIKEDVFTNKKVRIIGTGGFARLFTKENLFDDFIPDLILQGLKIAFELNKSNEHKNQCIVHYLENI